MAAIKLGIIGLGIMGERMLRAALAHDADAVTVTALWDPDAAAVARLTDSIDTLPVKPSADQVMAAADCLYIASPPATHLDHAHRALDRNRAVFCEKPLAVALSDGEEFVRRVEDERHRVAVNFIFASSFAVDQLKSWLANGVVGTPKKLTIEVGFAAWPRPWQMDASAWLSRRAQGGFTREVVSHFLFLTNRLAGAMTLTGAEVDYRDGEADAAETRIAATLTAGELPVTLTGGVGTTEKPDHNLWILEGDAGAIRLRDWSIAEIRQEDGSWAEAADALPNEQARMLVLARQLDKLAAMTAGRRQDLATVSEAFQVQDIVEKILTS